MCLPPREGTREYVVVHAANIAIWTSITLDRDDAHALIVHGNYNGLVSTVAYSTAYELLQYLTQSGDYVVQEV